MAYRVLTAAEAFRRPSNQMGVLNSGLARRLGAEALGARLWRLAPGRASTRHRQRVQEELDVVLQGTGRMRIGGQSLSLEPLSAVRVGAEETRQVFNDTEAFALRLVVGAPPEPANTLEMTAADLRVISPDGPRALPPELAGG